MNISLVDRRWLAAAVLALLAALAVCVILLSGSSGADDEPHPATVGVENACKSLSLHDPSSRIVYGKGPQGPEMTEWHSDGSYTVTRCTTSGQLVVRQQVIPVRSPDGPKMLVAETATPTEVISALLPADFSETAEGIAAWNEAGDKMLARTLPPTSEGPSE